MIPIPYTQSKKPLPEITPAPPVREPGVFPPETTPEREKERPYQPAPEINPKPDKPEIRPK